MNIIKKTTRTDARSLSHVRFLYRRLLIEKLWKQMRPDKPLRPDNGEVSTATVLKVLGNRTYSARLQVKPPLRSRVLVSETKSIIKPSNKKDSVEPKPESSLSLLPNNKVGEKDRRKAETLEPSRSSLVHRKSM